MCVKCGRRISNIWLKDICCCCPTQQGVVDTPHDVAFRVTAREHRFCHHRSRITGIKNVDGDSGVFGELCKSVIDIGVGGWKRRIGNEREFVDVIRATSGCSGEQNAERESEETVVHVQPLSGS